MTMPDETWLRGDWMQTFTGRRYYPMDPRCSDIDPWDIAHALSFLCRYGGHVSRFYCPHPDERVLTADLRWVSAGDLNVGDRLFGFDEKPIQLGQAGKLRRRFRPSIVTATVPVRRRIMRLVMEDERTVRASVDHPWLVATKVSRNQTWMTTGDIARDLQAGRLRYMHRFTEPWSADASWSAGWLAGVLDGEGHVSFTNRGGVQFGVAQRPGSVLTGIEEQFQSRGFATSMHSVGISDVQSVTVNGGWREMMRLLGTVRPVRLIEKIDRGLFDGSLSKQMNGIGAPLRIVSAYDEGDGDVAGIETSSQTYICEGFGAHNSVAEHCVLMSRAVPEEDALHALLHDATEAYVVDVPRPVKRYLTNYKEIEEKVWGAIATRFGISSILPASVLSADNRILLTERAALLPDAEKVWPGLEGLKPLDVTIRAWGPERAKIEYLDRLTELGGMDC